VVSIQTQNVRFALIVLKENGYQHLAEILLTLNAASAVHVDTGSKPLENVAHTQIYVGSGITLGSVWYLLFGWMLIPVVKYAALVS
jgi:hypothetical protein